MIGPLTKKKQLSSGFQVNHLNINELSDKAIVYRVVFNWCMKKPITYLSQGNLSSGKREHPWLSSHGGDLLIKREAFSLKTVLCLK